MKTAFRLISFLMLAGLWAVGGADVGPAEAASPACQAARDGVAPAERGLKAATEALINTGKERRRALEHVRQTGQILDRKIRSNPEEAKTGFELLERASADAEAAVEANRAAFQKLQAAYRAYQERFSSVKTKCKPF